MNRCVIVGGAPIENYEAVRSCLREDDFVIYCDCGLKHREALGAEPDLIVGDFDSYENPKEDVETIVLPTVKDDTDTGYAVKTALERGFEDFLLVGAAGRRMDHTLGNLSLLLMLDTKGKKAKLIDDYSEMEIISREPKYIGPEFPFFSLLNISGLAKGISIRHAKYCLEDAELTVDFALGVSNEPLPGETAEVSVGEGRLLLLRVREG